MPNVSEICKFLEQHNQVISKVIDSDDIITGVSSHWNANKHDFAWTISKIIETYRFFDGSLLLLPDGATMISNSIVCKNVKLAFVKVLNEFFDKPFLKNGLIKPNIGKNVKIGKSSILGAEGFGHVMDERGVYIRFPHLGGLSIGDNVEIGENVCIQRGSIADTRIMDNARIWHGVNIGHNCFIGKRSVILNNSTICGSVTIGADVWIAPAATVMNKITIGASSVVGLGSVVINDVEEGVMVAGNPARVIRKVDEVTHIMRSHR